MDIRGPSEHTITLSGITRRYPFELQFEHTDDTGQKLVLCVFLEKGYKGIDYYRSGEFLLQRFQFDDNYLESAKRKDVNDILNLADSDFPFGD